MINRHAETPSDSSRFSAGVAIAAVLVALLLIVLGAQGVRGSDQYWYVADVETIEAGSSPESNTWFPAGVLRAGTADYPNYIYHNGPLLHLVAALGAVVPASAYERWIAVNLLCHALIVGVVFLWLRHRTNAAARHYAVALAALAPIGIWQGANALRETWFGALTALALYTFYMGLRHRLVWLLTALILVLGALAHPMFLILLLLLACWQGVVLWRESSKRGQTLISLAVTVLGIVFVQAVGKAWFPSSFQPDLTSIIVSAVPDLTNMHWHFADVQRELTPSFLWSKFVHALEKQFITPAQVPVYLLGNLGFLAWLYLWIRAPRRWLGPLLVFSILFGLYAAMVVLQQNHPRFQQLVAVATFLCIGLALHEAGLTRRQLAILCLPVLAGCLLIDALMVQRLRDEAATEARSIEQIRSTLEPEADTRYLFVNVRQHDPMSFALRPADALFIRDHLISEAGARKAIELFGPTVLVTRPDADAYGLVETADELARIQTDAFGPLVAFRLSQ